MKSNHPIHQYDDCCLNALAVKLRST